MERSKHKCKMKRVAFASPTDLSKHLINMHIPEKGVRFFLLFLQSQVLPDLIVCSTHLRMTGLKGTLGSFASFVYRDVLVMLF